MIKIKKSFYIFIILLIGSAWGLTFSLIKIIVDLGVDPLSIAFWQTIISLIILSFATIFTFKNIEMKVKYILSCIYIALCGLIPGLIYFHAAYHVSPGILSIAVAMVPMMTYFLSISLKLEIKSFRKSIGLSFGIISIFFLIIPNQETKFLFSLNWFIFACLGSFLYSLENILIAYSFPKKINPLTIAFLTNSIALIILIPLILYKKFYMINFPPNKEDFFLILIGVISGLCYIIFIYLIKKLGPVFASQTAFIVTLTGFLWSILFFNESFTKWVWISLLLMLIGILLVRSNEKF